MLVQAGGKALGGAQTNLVIKMFAEGQKTEEKYLSIVHHLPK